MSDSVNSIEYIYEELAQKHNLPKQAVEHLIIDLWRGIKSEMGSRSGKDIIIPNLGTIYVHPLRLKEEIEGIKEVHKNHEDKFKGSPSFYEENYDEWIEYIKKSTRISKVETMYNTMNENIERRKNRKKGERGL